MSKIDRKAVKRAVDKNALVAKFLEALLLRERNWNQIAVRRAKIALEESGTLVTFDEANEMLETLAEAGVGKMEGEGYQRRLRFTVPMQVLKDLAQVESDLLGLEKIKSKIVRASKSSKDPAIVKAASVLAENPRVFTVHLGKNRTADISLPSKFSKEDADLVTMFLQRQVD